MPKRSRKERRKQSPSLAERANKHALYQKSVQAPEWDIRVFTKAFRRVRGRKPFSLREDFCGTAHFAAEWVKSGRRRTAVGVDLDEPTLDWGREHVLNKLTPELRERVQLVQGNVLDVTEPLVDLTCAMNFSFCIFKTRPELIAYFEAAHRGLRDDGMLICEQFGGTEAIEPIREKRRVGKVRYVWEQAKYNPITNEILCHIHFEFRDGSKIKKAFTYDWRLWTIPEIRECMLEAGFSDTQVLWEDDDKEGRYYPATEEENQATYIVYIVGIK